MQGIRVDPQDFIRNAGKALRLNSGPAPGANQGQAVSAEALEAAVLQQGGRGNNHNNGYNTNRQNNNQHGQQHGGGPRGHRQAATAYNPNQQGGGSSGFSASAQPYVPQQLQQQHGNQQSHNNQGNQGNQNQSGAAATVNNLNFQHAQQAQIAQQLHLHIAQLQMMQNLQNHANAANAGTNLAGNRNEGISIAALANLFGNNFLQQQQQQQQQLQQQQAAQQQNQQNQGQARHPYSPPNTQQVNNAQQQGGNTSKAQAPVAPLVGPAGLALNALASPFASLGPGGAAALFSGGNGHSTHIPASVQNAFSNASNNGSTQTQQGNANNNALPPLPPSPHSSTHHGMPYAPPTGPPAPTLSLNTTGLARTISGSGNPDLSVLTTPPPPVPGAGPTRAAGLKSGLSTPTTATGAAPPRPNSPPSVTSNTNADALGASLPYTAPGTAPNDAEGTAKVVLSLKNVEAATEKQVQQFVQQGFGNVEGVLTACLECEGTWYAIFKDEETAQQAQQNVRNKILADAKPFIKLLTLRQLPKPLQRTNNWKTNAAPAENCGIWNRSGTNGRDSPPKFRQTALPPTFAAAPGQTPTVPPVTSPAIATPVAAIGGEFPVADGATEQTDQRAWTATEKGKYKEAAQYSRLLPVVQVPGPETGAGRGFGAGRGKPVRGDGVSGMAMAR